jgi:hypothetical protein
MKLPLTRTRLGLLAGVLGATGALTIVAASAQSEPLGGSSDDPPSHEVSGDISGPCDEAEHAGDPACAGVAPTNPASPASPGNPGTTPTTAAPAAPASTAGTHTLRTPGGTVTYRSNGTSITLVSAVPAQGWRAEVEQAAGREVELDFRSGSQRVQVNLEIEDGRVRERVRVRDDATGIDDRFENGAVDDHDAVDDHGADDSSGPGSEHSGGTDDSGSGSSGSGSSGSGRSGGVDDNPHPED